MLFGSRTEDDQVEHISHLTGLRWLYLRDTRITGAGLASVASLENLEILIYGAHYSDGSEFEGIGPQLAACSTLEDLWLQQVSITDDDLLALKDLTQLRRLPLYRTAVRGPGLQVLSELPNLEGLSLSGLEPDALDLESLPQLPSTLDHIDFSAVTLPSYILDFKPTWVVGVDRNGETAASLSCESGSYHLIDRGGNLRIVNVAAEGTEEAIRRLIDE
jgi:hypothetical protein